MASFIYDELTDKMIPSEEYHFIQFMKKEHLHMTVGNRKVEIYYNSDQMEPTRHMADNKYYTSKKKFREATKRAGCIEVGTENIMKNKRKQVKLDRRQRRDDIKKAIHDLRNGKVKV